jgi:hypothetical protein
MKKAGWLKDGIATPRGIVNEWNGFEKKTVAPKPEPKLNLESMTKDELEALGREHDIELDKREKKASLIDVLKYVVKR